MKKTILTLTVITLLTFHLQAQNATLVKEVKTTLKGYLQAGDQNNVEALKPYLNTNFRVIVYDDKKKATSILDKKKYSAFIKTKKFGGYPRTAEYHEVLFINENMATVQVTLTSPGKPTLKNFYSLVKERNMWTIIQDFVTLVK